MYSRISCKMMTFCTLNSGNGSFSTVITNSNILITCILSSCSTLGIRNNNGSIACKSCINLTFSSRDKYNNILFHIVTRVHLEEVPLYIRSNTPNARCHFTTHSPFDLPLTDHRGVLGIRFAFADALPALLF